MFTQWLASPASFGRLILGICAWIVCVHASETIVFSQEDTLNTTPLPISVVLAFPELQWKDWESEDESGKVTSLRPILLTHLGDGSSRKIVPTQRGVTHLIPADSNPRESQIFMDVQERVSYRDEANEEGFLGLAFHPKFRENGQFFVYYTNRSRFHTIPGNPNRGDPGSEEILLVIDKPFWNHDGGTLCFGPDGFLYIAVGDGGSANDPHGNGQSLGTWLGKVLRIDVDHSGENTKYAIPPDNPFVHNPQAKPEIWAYGLRNIWRMAFDRKTKILWAGDVGQDLWEEVDLVTKGGNFGWSVREGKHPFGKHGRESSPDLIDPIWEYSHEIGKSIIGGLVYRGNGVPELEGAYLYSDYVSGKLWALWYNADTEKVVANREILLPRPTPILSFGEDESGEVYFMTDAPDGNGIYRFAPSR
jgi:glucose/arabinose dehydrogenase